MALLALLFWARFSIGQENTAGLSFSFHNTPLRAVLEKLAKQSTTNIIFSDELVSGLKVEGRLSDFDLETALHFLLDGTTLSFQQTGLHQIVVVSTSGDTYEVQGRVLDAVSLAPLPDTNIRILGKATGAAADRLGNFRLLHTARRCTLEISHIGYTTRRLSLDPDSVRQTVSIRLTREVIMTPEVTVNARPQKILKSSEAVGHITAKPSRLAALTGIGPPDLFRSIALLPGINLTRDGTNELRLRGGRPSENLVLIDGITLYRHSHGSGLTTAFDSNLFDSSEVYYGTQPVKYDGRLSGVIDLETRDGSFDRKHVSVSLTTLALRGAMELPVSDHASLLLFARTSYEDYLTRRQYSRLFRPSFAANTNPSGKPLNSIPSRLPNPTIRFHDLLGKFTVQLGTNDRVSATFLNNEDRVVAGLRPNDEMEQAKNSGIGLNWHRQWRQTLLSTFHASTSYNRVTYRRTTDGSGLSGRKDTLVENSLREFKLLVENEWHVTDTHQFHFGGSFLRYETAARDSDLSVPNAPLHRHSEFASVYLQDKWHIFPRLQATAGAKMTLDLQQTKQFTDGVVSADWRMSRNVRLRIGWANHHQFIDQRRQPLALFFTQDAWHLANGKSSQPPSSWHLESGVQVTSDWIDFDAEIYRKTFRRNAIEGDDLNRIGLLAGSRASGSGVSKGLDFSIRKQGGPLMAWLNLSFGQVTYGIQTAAPDVLRKAQEDRQDVKLVTRFTVNPGWYIGANWFLAMTQSEPSVFRSEGGTTTQSQFQILQTSPTSRNTAHRLDIQMIKAFPFGTVKIAIHNVYNRNNSLSRLLLIDQDQFLESQLSALGFTPTFDFTFKF